MIIMIIIMIMIMIMIISAPLLGRLLIRKPSLFLMYEVYDGPTLAPARECGGDAAFP